MVYIQIHSLQNNVFSTILDNIIGVCSEEFLVWRKRKNSSQRFECYLSKLSSGEIIWVNWGSTLYIGVREPVGLVHGRPIRSVKQQVINHSSPYIPALHTFIADIIVISCYIDSFSLVPMIVFQFCYILPMHSLPDLTWPIATCLLVVMSYSLIWTSIGLWVSSTYKSPHSL